MSVTQMEGHVFGTLVMPITAIKVAKLGQIGGKLGNQRKIHIFFIFIFPSKDLSFPQMTYVPSPNIIGCSMKHYQMVVIEKNRTP